MKILLVDEHDCFGKVKQFVDCNPEVIKPSYFLAPDKSFLQEMTNACREADLIIIHKHIWVDDCHQDDPPCNGILAELKQTVKAPVIEVGGKKNIPEKCPQDMQAAFTQIADAINRLGQIVGAKVLPVNPQETGHRYIHSLEMLGSGKIGCTLRTESGKTSKYYLLDDLIAA